MKTAIIVGGSGGIGSEIVKKLLEYEIRIVSIDKVDGKIKNERLETIVYDLTEKNVEKISQLVCEKIINIDYFINAMGYYEARNVDDSSMDYLNKMINTNLVIPTVLIQEVYKSMQQHRRGKIVIISSAAAYVGSRDIAYSVSKAGEIGLVKGLAKSSKNSNVFVYGIAPGIVRTKMSKNMSRDRMEEAIAGTLLHRMCEPREIADLVEYILFKDNGYMSGSIIHMNNGLYLN